MKRRPPKLPSRRGPLRVTVGVRIYQPDNSADITLAALHRLADDDFRGLHTLLRQAIIDSLFKAYAIRFRASLPIMGKLYKAKLNLSPAKRRYYYERLEETERSLQKLLGKGRSNFDRGDEEHYLELKNKAVRYNKALTGTKLSDTYAIRKQQAVDDSIQLDDFEKSQKRLADLAGTGSFKERALQVLDRFTDPSAIRKQVRRTNLTVYFGNFEYMGGNRTLSDPDMATSLHSKSKMNIMWRQLEFGTGKFAKKAGNIVQVPRDSEHKRLRIPREYRDPRTGEMRVRYQYRKLTDGSWVLGNQDRGGGLHILGSYPGNWLRDQSGLQYDGYSKAFESMFTLRLGSALRKRR